MLSSGDIIENPKTGETMQVIRSSGETNGEELVFELTVSPGGAVPAEHIHPNQTEHFAVKRGKLRLRKDGVERTYEAGDEETIPPGTPHMWWNGGDEKLSAVINLTPGDGFESFLASLFALAQADETDEDGMPDPLQLAVMMQKYDHVIRPTKPPKWLQKPLFGLLAPIGRMMGREADKTYRGSSS